MANQSSILRGAVNVTKSDGIKVHTYTAPNDGWHVNTHLIELPTQLIAVDAQYTLPYAREVLAYAANLGKPISRLYVTHYHPDHLLGAAAFAMPIHALPEVKIKIGAVGDRVAAEEHEKFPESIPTRAEKPTVLVAPGSEVIDGVKLDFLLLQHAETENALMIGLPEHGILITQDLIYNGVHVFLGEQAFDSWSAALRACRRLPYDKILPGHGDPGGPELYDSMLHYLATARELLGKSRDSDDFKARLLTEFPDFGGAALLDHQKRFLFPPRKEPKV